MLKHGKLCEKAAGTQTSQRTLHKKKLLFAKLRHRGSKKKETAHKSYFRCSKDRKIERKDEKEKN